MTDDSSDDLFGDAMHTERSSDLAAASSTPFRELSFASCLLSFFYDDQLTAHSRELGSNEEASWRLAPWPPPSSAAAFVIRPLLPFARETPDRDLVLDSTLIAALSPLGAKGAVCLGTPSGHLYLLPVDPQHLARDVVLLGSVDQPLVDVEALRVGEKTSSLLVMVGRSGRAGYFYLAGDKLVFKVGQLEADVLHCQVVHNVLFCACGRNQLVRANFEDFQLRTKTWRLNGDFLPQEQGGCTLGTAEGAHVSFTDLCLEPARFQLSDGPPLPPSEGLARLQERAEALEALRERHIAADEYLRQANTACRLRQLDLEERKAFFEVTATVESSPRHGYQLRLELRNRLEGSLSPAWRLVTGLRTHHGAAHVVEQPLPCLTKGASGAVLLESAFSEAAHAGPVALTVDLVLPLDAAVVAGVHGGLFSVRLLERSLSLLDFLLPRDDQPRLDLRSGPPGTWRGLRSLQEAFLAPLLPPSAARRPPPLCAAAVELHEGDRMPFLPAPLDWLLREDAARRDFSCFGVPLALEAAFPTQSAFRATVRRISVRCAAPRLLLGVAEALAALVVRRKAVTSEELKQDLLLLRALGRSDEAAGGEDVAAEFQELLDANALLNGLRCV